MTLPRKHHKFPLADPKEMEIYKSLPNPGIEPRDPSVCVCMYVCIYIHIYLYMSEYIYTIYTMNKIDH